MTPALIALGTFVIVLVALVALELMRRRGMDPVARIADVVSPPRMAAGNGAASPTAAAASAAAGAAS